MQDRRTINMIRTAIDCDDEQARKIIKRNAELDLKLKIPNGSVTDAFIALGNCGLDNSEHAIRAYANIAHTMGRPLIEMVNAVIEASVGEFERLKGFGIRARVSGNKVTFTYCGPPPKVNNDADGIQRYIMTLGGSSVRHFLT